MTDLRVYKSTKTLFDELNNIENNPLDGDVLEALGFHVVRYTDLNKYAYIEDVVNPNGIILFTPISDYNDGHYSALWLDGRNNLNYWCSYGMNLPQTLQYSTYMKKTPARDEDYLINLVGDYINRTGKSFLVNHTPFQSNKACISTCGRFSLIRLIKRQLSHDEFKDWFCNRRPVNMPNDLLISMITYLIQ
jgi:hypothetical protein